MSVQLFHLSDRGVLVSIGETNVGFGMVSLYRCEICGIELDSTDYTSIARLEDGEMLDYKNRPVPPSAQEWIKTLHTQVIELDGGKSLVLRLQDNGMVDVTVELSETECYGVEVPVSLFVNSMAAFLRVVEKEL